MSRGEDMLEHKCYGQAKNSELLQLFLTGALRTMRTNNVRESMCNKTVRLDAANSSQHFLICWHSIIIIIIATITQTFS